MTDLDAIHVEDLGELAHVVGLGRLDLLHRQHRARLGLAGRIADARSEVADDQHRQMPRVLEGTKLRQDDRPTERDATRRRVHAKLDPKRAPSRGRLLKSLRQCAFRQHIDGITQ